jgi:hypothetical protein
MRPTVVCSMRDISQRPDHALKRALPLSLLRFKILRPALVLILLRKPCSRFLFLTLG